LDQLTIGILSSEQQDENLACYAKKLNKGEALINWRNKADMLEKTVRAFNPWPVAYTTIENKQSEIQNLRIWDTHIIKNTSPLPQSVIPGTIIESSKNGIVVVTGDGLLSITQLQLPGSKTLSAEQVLNAKRELFKPGTKLG